MQMLKPARMPIRSDPTNKFAYWAKQIIDYLYIILTFFFSCPVDYELQNIADVGFQPVRIYISSRSLISISMITFSIKILTCITIPTAVINMQL